MTGVFGAPIYISLPHLMNVDKDVADLVVGMSPDQEKHEAYLGIEPWTGVTLDARVRMQLNVDLKPLHFRGTINTTWFPKVNPALFVPSVWFMHGGSARKQDTGDITGEMYMGIRAVPGVKWGSFAGGILFMGLAIHTLLKLFAGGDFEQPLSQPLSRSHIVE